MVIKYRVRTRPGDLGEFISTLPYRTRGLATEAAADFIIGDENHGLKHEPKYRYVTRKRAYGKTFVSDKQRKYVMAMIKSGKITPGKANRTHAISNAWRKKNSKTKTTIMNDAEGVEYVMGDKKQARQPALVGWRKISVIVKTNTPGAMKAADKAVTRYIKSKVK